MSSTKKAKEVNAESEAGEVEKVESAPVQETPVQETVQAAAVAAPQDKKSGSCLKIAIILAVVFFLLILCSGMIFGLYWFVIRDKPAEEDDVSEKQSCTYNGEEYDDGEGFPSDDGCNSCSCTDGKVACTLMACEDETTTSTTSTAQETIKDVTFSLLGDEAGGLYSYTLEFSAKVPPQTEVDESQNTVGASFGSPTVYINGNSFSLSVSMFYELYPFEYSNPVELFTHSQFGKIWRVNNATSDDTMQIYTTDIENSDEVCKNEMPFVLSAPCGQGIIDMPNMPFYVSCTADDPKGMTACDNIVKSLTAVEVPL